MSEHAWAEEHVAAYVAGGLDAREAERFDAHTRECPECAAAFEATRDLDRGLSELFAGVRPGLEVAERAVARLRTDAAPDALRKLVTVLAAFVALGICGALVAPQMFGVNMNETFSFVGSSIRPYDGASEARAGLRSEAAALAARQAEAERAAAERRRADETYTQDNTKRPEAPAPDPRSGPPPPPSLGPPPAPVLPTTGPVPPVEPGVSPQPKPGEPKPDPKQPDPKAPEPSPEPVRRIIIRSGEMEFEVESFDAATATITKLVLGIKGAFIATVNSDKLPNGRVKGSITVRTPPEHLDGLVLDLRRELGKGGELKGVKLTSQDVTKMYTDLESRLRAARAMETRLLQMIKDGKGDIKQLLEAERELGVWRTKIEEFEGELRYYSNLAAFSTLTIGLTEKDIRAAAAVTERERVQAGVEVEDVDKAYQEVLKAVLEAKGRVLKSEVKQLSAGQFNAVLHFEIAPEASGPTRDRLRQLGRIARLEIDRAAQPENGTLPTDAKTKRGDSVFLVQLYNLANIAPRELATLRVVAPDVPVAYQNLRDAVAKAGGRVLTAVLNEQDRTNILAQLDFEVRRAEEAAVRAALEAAGEVLSREVTRTPEAEGVTDAKVQYKVSLVSANRLPPRQTHTLSIEVQDVEGKAAEFAAAVAEVKGRQLSANTSRDRGGNATGSLSFEVPLTAAAGLVEKFKNAGVVRQNTSSRDPQASEGRFATARIDVKLTSPDEIVAEGEGLWPQVKRGLTYSATVLLKSVTWVVFGLCVVLPWAVIGYVVYRVVRRWFVPEPATVPAAGTPPASPGGTT